MVDVADAAREATIRAEQAENWAAVARSRATFALRHARWDEANGYDRAATVHRRAAVLHELAAERQEEAATLHRLHVRHLLEHPAAGGGAEPDR